MKIRVAIVDDHPMILDGLQTMLAGQEHITLTGCYNDGEELLTALKTQQPDILLLDIQLPGTTGDQLAPVLLQAFPCMRLVALTNFDSPLYLNTMLRLGVKGYLLKTSRKETLIKAIEAIYNGETFIEPALAQRAREEAAKIDKQIYARLSLTLREKQILRLLVDGSSNQEIADQLFMSYHTVRNYRARIFNKLSVNTIGELVKKALTTGLG